MAEILAAYTDKILKKGSRKDLATSIEDLIEQQVALFSFVIDKDLYFEVFRNYLARRLLQDKSEDMEAERLIITNMKVSCGMAQIKNLEGMMSDIQTAKEEAKAYEETMSFKQQTFDY